MNAYRFIQGGIHQDERGIIRFVNDFKFEDVKRFHISENVSTNIVKAWQGHKIEKKYFYAITGAFLIGLVRIDNWENPSKNLKADRFILSDKDSQLLEIPPGYANGFRSLESNSKLLSFSDCTIDEGDIFRYDSSLWMDWFDVQTSEK